jgi:hypothetical protein
LSSFLLLLGTHEYLFSLMISLFFLKSRFHIWKKTGDIWVHNFLTQFTSVAFCVIVATIVSLRMLKS